jgi:CRP-like cAMP-binding protein
MNTDIFQFIYNHPLIKKADLREIKNAHLQINFSKGSNFLENGKMKNEYYLIEDGLLRSYVHDFNESEITTDFQGKN